MAARRRWTAAEDSYLRENAPSRDYQAIADHLGRSRRAVGHRARRLGVHIAALKRWTPTEDELIRRHLDEGLAAVADRLGRNPVEVSRRAGIIGLSFRRRAKRRLDYNGYVVLRRSTSSGIRVTEFEHRSVAAAALGRPLTAEERVHHIDFSKAHNDPSNLFVCRDRAHHQLVHRTVDRLVPLLLERGIISFDRAQGSYVLREAA